jgi:hypothetical protein
MEGGKIRLIKWKDAARVILEECPLENLLEASSLH